MKRKWPRTGIVIWVSFVTLLVSASGAAGLPADPAKPDTAAVKQTGTGYLENITFEKLKGVERTTLMLSRRSDVATEDQGGRLLLVKLDNLFVPQDLRRVQGEGMLDNVIRVVPVQRTVKGLPQAVVTLELNKGVPYSVRQDGHNVVIDFNVAALPRKTSVAAVKTAGLAQNNPVGGNSNPPPQAPPATKPATVSAARNGLVTVAFRHEDIKSALQQIADQGGVRIIYGDDVTGTVNLELKSATVDQALDAVLAKHCLTKTRSGDTINIHSMKKIIADERDLYVLPHANRLISLEFQDAPIKSVFQVLAEHGDVNIVSGDDVKGNVTIHLRKIPWRLAFDTVIRTNGLVARLSCNNLITVMTLKKFRDEEKSIEDAEKARRESEKARKDEEQLKKTEAGKLQQISIEAKIIEASTTFVRDLGVKWGAASYGTAGKGTGWALLGGTNTDTSKARSWGYPTEVPFQSFEPSPAPLGRPSYGSVATAIPSMAVNYPTVFAGPALGLIIGGASAVLEAQLAALESQGVGKIISTPRVVIMEGEKAIIKQGEEIPVTTPGTATSPPTTTYRPAELRLEVTPKITDDGRVSMTVSAINNRPNRADKDLLTGNMPIFTNQVDSKVVILDGDTLVIGGVMRSEESKIDTGVPWIYKVPVLGWLFKQENTQRTKRELLIFVTPKIIKPDIVRERSELPRS
jgi:type IV pilus assembly protein PilQ